MNENQDNSNLESSSEGNSKQVNSPSEEKDNLESEQTIEPDKKDSINKYSSVEKKGPSIKNSFLLLVLFIALGAGFYFYAYKKDSGLSKTLSEGLRKSFSQRHKVTILLKKILKKFQLSHKKLQRELKEKYLLINSLKKHLLIYQRK